ncbi:hypothetical protein FKM82_013806 [Ascaphus truei]
MTILPPLSLGLMTISRISFSSFIATDSVLVRLASSILVDIFLKSSMTIFRYTSTGGQICHGGQKVDCGFKCDKMFSSSVCIIPWSSSRDSSSCRCVCSCVFSCNCST